MIRGKARTNPSVPCCIPGHERASDSPTPRSRVHRILHNNRNHHALVPQRACLHYTRAWHRSDRQPRYFFSPGGVGAKDLITTASGEE